MLGWFTSRRAESKPPEAIDTSAFDLPALDGPPAGYRLRVDLPPLRERFLKLYRAFQEGQWHPDDGSIDWSREPIIEDLFIYREEARELRAFFVADFYYGEEFTLRGAGRRLDALEEMDEKSCYALMIADEHRHAEVFGRYQRKLAMVRPADPRLIETLEWAESLDAEAFILGAMILETISVHAMPMMWRSTRDPLLTAFLPRIHRDETRHEAYSHLYLEARAARWTPARRAQLAALAADMYARQVRYMLERNPIIPFAIPKPIALGLDLVARRALKSGTKSLVRRFVALDLPPSDEMARWS
jgi:hypothetical protein